MFTLNDASIDEAGFKQALEEFKKRLDLEQQINLRTNAAVQEAEKGCRQLLTLAGSELLHCSLVDKTLTISANDRTLTMVPAAGIASDARLSRPRGLYCSQILVFGHISGQQESKLLSAVRVYPDGVCSDGDQNWRVDGDSSGFPRYIARLVARHLLACELYWPQFEELPGYIQSAPVSDDKVQTNQLQHTCIGFECSLEASGKEN